MTMKELNKVKGENVSILELNTQLHMQTHQKISVNILLGFGRSLVAQ